MCVVPLQLGEDCKVSVGITQNIALNWDFLAPRGRPLQELWQGPEVQQEGGSLCSKEGKGKGKEDVE